MKIISRKEAKAAGLKRYFTRRPCKHGHVAERQVSDEHCVECKRAKCAAYRAAHPEKVKAYNAAHRKEQLAHDAAYRKRHPGKVNAKNNKRRATELQAIPPGTDLKAIAKIYEQCAWITAASGIEHEVDHGIPLQGELVCGLHVPANLRIITAAENAAKGNRYAP